MFFKKGDQKWFPFFPPLNKIMSVPFTKLLDTEKKELKVFLEFSRTMLSHILDMLP